MANQDTQNMVMVVLFAVGGFIIYKMMGSLPTVPDNPGKSAGKSFNYVTKQYKDAVTTTADHMAGSTDESFNRQFDDKQGGGFADVYMNQVEGTFNAMTPDKKTVESAWNKTTPDFGHVGSAVKDTTGKVEDTWNKATPDVGKLW